MVDFSKLEDHNESDFDDDGPDNILPESDGTEIVTVSADSALNRLKKSIEKKEQQTVVYSVPEDSLPELGGVVELEFSKQITTHELELWRKQAKMKNRRRDEVDSGKLAGLMLSNKSISVRLDGKPLVDDDGDKITLRSEEMMGLTGSRSAADGVRRLLGDGTATSMSDALATAAGYGDDIEDAGNPT